jgi:hypothetical protein
MTAVWDIEKYKNDNGKDAEGKYIFSEEPKEVNERGDIGGGGISKFGLMAGVNKEGGDPPGSNSIEDVPAKINWTDVKIYVYDKALFDQYVEKVKTETGKTASANTADKVIEVQKPAS